MFKETVYHGTLKHKANRIQREGFMQSEKETEWLGTGIYFFAQRKDAEVWANREVRKGKNQGSSPALLEAVISCEDDKFFDLDISANMEQLVSAVKPYLINGNNGHAVIDGPDAKLKLRCLACNFYKKLHGIQVLAYSFPRMKNNDMGFPVCVSQRQYAVNTNKNIIELRELAIGGKQHEKSGS